MITKAKKPRYIYTPVTGMTNVTVKTDILNDRFCDTDKETENEKHNGKAKT